MATILAKPTISSAGLTPCANGWPALCAKPCRFPGPTVFMSAFFDYSFIITIARASVNGSLLPQRVMGNKWKPRAYVCSASSSL